MWISSQRHITFANAAKKCSLCLRGEKEEEMKDFDVLPERLIGPSINTFVGWGSGLFFRNFISPRASAHSQRANDSHLVVGLLSFRKNTLWSNWLAHVTLRNSMHMLCHIFCGHTKTYSHTNQPIAIYLLLFSRALSCSVSLKSDSIPFYRRMAHVSFGMCRMKFKSLLGITGHAVVTVSC